MTNITDTARHAAASLAETAKGAASDTFAEVKGRATEAASRTIGAARAEALDRAEGVKDSLISEGERLAETLRGSMGSEDSVQGKVLGVVADSIADLSRSLHGKSLGDMMGVADGFARRNPGAFVAGAALAGFALARFARASTPSLSGQYATGDYGLNDDAQAYGDGGHYGSPKPEGMGYGEYAADTTAAGTGAGAYGSSVTNSSMTTHDDDFDGDLGGDIGGGFGTSSVVATPDADEESERSPFDRSPS